MKYLVLLAFERHQRIYPRGIWSDFSEWPEATRQSEINDLIHDGHLEPSIVLSTTPPVAHAAEPHYSKFEAQP